MAGIYHNPELGVISLSSDGANWLTIADKNLGATLVYNDGDTLSEANSGKYYQWGNNYGFPFTGSVTTSSTKVNASTYGPSDYYESSTFIIYDSSWDSSYNKNLWGGVTGTVISTKGPCLEGFHIPLNTEWSSLKDLIDSFSLSETYGFPYKKYLKMPFSGMRNGESSGTYDIGTTGYYWSSSINNDAYRYSYLQQFQQNSIYINSNSNATNGASIRPFANTPVVPDYTWERLYGDDIPIPPKIFKRIVNNGNYYYFKDAPTHASGVTLNKSSIKLTEAGQSEKLIATVSPSDAVEKAVTWTSSNTNIAIVAQDGTVTSVVPGKCNITCTTVDGGLTAICNVIKVINFATQGPCPDGFHVPLDSEWTSVINMGITLGAWTSTGYSNFCKRLHMPLSGRRDSYYGDRNMGYGKYWTSKSYNGEYAYYLQVSGTAISAGSSSYSSYGYTIRAFKNVAVVPDSSWTTIYSSGDGGIYWNPTLGLISISTNGSSWKTIADKNLGASVVWNDGDTLAFNNCGYYFQWGNNYGFTWNTLPSSTTNQTNAGTYGPGNYYSSSTFIKRQSSPYGWDSSNNKNLRGGEDGNVPV